MPVGYNKKNMEEASSYYKPSEGQQNLEKGISDTWRSIKGLVGADDEGDAMKSALKNRSKKFESDE